MSGISKIELRQFRQFITVAEELHFRRAAARLGMAQPPLSQAIQKLEAEIGAELFDRSERRIRLTEAGAALLDEARRVVAQADRAVVAAQRAARGLTGVLRITYVGSAVYDTLPRLIRRYRQDHPEVDLVLRERTSVGQIRALQAGDADVGFAHPPLFGAHDLRYEPILHEPLIVALPDNHHLVEQKSIALRELAYEPFVCFPASEGPSLYAKLSGACQEAGFTMRVAQEAVQMHTIIALVAAGLGVALVPASMRHLGQAGVVYRELSDVTAALQVDLAVVWRRGEPSSVVTGFLQTVRHKPHSGSSDVTASL